MRFLMTKVLVFMMKCFSIATCFLICCMRCLKWDSMYCSSQVFRLKNPLQALDRGSYVIFQVGYLRSVIGYSFWSTDHNIHCSTNQDGASCRPPPTHLSEQSAMPCVDGRRPQSLHVRLPQQPCLNTST